MDNDGDAIVGQHSFLQAGRLLLVLQGTGGKADVTGTLLHGGDACAGTGGIVVDGDVFVGRHVGLAQRADDLLHGGGTVGGDGAADGGGRGIAGVAAVVVVAAVVIGLIAAAGQQSQRHDSAQCKCKDLFHIRTSFLL